MVELIMLHWPQILAVVALIVWLARLEARVSQNSDEVRRMEIQLNKQFQERDERRKEDMATLNSTLSEVRNDIKTLLVHVGKDNGK